MIALAFSAIEKRNLCFDPMEMCSNIDCWNEENMHLCLYADGM